MFASVILLKITKNKTAKTQVSIQPLCEDKLRQLDWINSNCMKLVVY